MTELFQTCGSVHSDFSMSPTFEDVLDYLSSPKNQMTSADSLQNGSTSSTIPHAAIQTPVQTPAAVANQSSNISLTNSHKLCAPLLTSTPVQIPSSTTPFSKQQKVTHSSAPLLELKTEVVQPIECEPQQMAQPNIQVLVIWHCFYTSCV